MCKLILRPLSIFNLFECTDARTYVYARVLLVAILLDNADLNHAKYEEEMTFDYEGMVTTSFSQNGAYHDDLITLKTLLSRTCS